MMERPRIAVLGCLTVDSVVTAAGDWFTKVCGGNVLYAAVGASIWERRVGIVTRAGSDYLDECLRPFEDAGIALGGVRRTMDRTGLHVAFAYRADGSRTRELPLKVMAAIPPEERPSFRDDTHEEERYLAFTPQTSDMPLRRGWVTSSALTSLNFGRAARRRSWMRCGHLDRISTSRSMRGTSQLIWSRRTDPCSTVWTLSFPVRTTRDDCARADWPMRRPATFRRMAPDTSSSSSVARAAWCGRPRVTAGTFRHTHQR